MGKSVNKVLRGLTGFEVRRAPRPKASVTGKGGKKPITFPLDYDEVSKEIITSVRSRTMTSREKLNALIFAVRYVVRHDIPGDIVECGVWRGGSMMTIAKTLQSVDAADRRLHLYDTYEGMTEPTEHDRRHDGRMAADMLAVTGRDGHVWAAASLEDVQQGMRETGYPEGLITYYKGPVEQTIPENAPEQISILRLDTDWYESTRHELEHLFPRLVPGGVLLLDDYGWWEGCRKAVEEFLADTKIPMLLMRMDEGRIGIKPPENWN
jgi:O-methyltransferase